MQPTTTNVPPAYKELFEEIGKQLNLRKWTLFKRIFLIVWPYLLMVVFFYVIDMQYGLRSLSHEQLKSYGIAFAVYLVLSAIYTVIIRFIFNIEKQIWIDSFFDKKNLTPSESWRIARKLFLPALRFRITLWLHYYLIPFVLVIIACWYANSSVVPLFNNTTGYETLLVVSIGSLFALVIGLIVYGYYLKTKLRYTWFIFLDTFGVNFSYEMVIDEMRKLNEVSKSETFKKSLMMNIGADSAKAIAGIAVSLVSQGFMQFGGVGGKMLGGLVKVYGEEVSRQAADIGNISAQYLLYRFARKEVYGNDQEVNHALYGLAQKSL